MSNKLYYRKQIEKIEELKKANLKPTLLLHTCCAVCFSSAYMQIKDSFDITVFFFNPNIYPSSEYDKRKEEVLRLIEIFNKEFNTNVKFIEKLEDFMSYKEKKVHKYPCYDCIYNRLLVSYNYAEKEKFDYVSTTLTVGRQKNSMLINLLGEQLEKNYKITKYFYSDFKKNNGILLSNEMRKKYNIYAQNYCGCEPYYQKKDN